QPTDSAFASANRAALIITLSLVPVFILGTVALLIFIFRALSPIGKLTAAAEMIAGGDLSARAAVKSKDEIGMLARSFNTMTDKLQALNTGLEQKVQEKTAELKQVLEKVSSFASEADEQRTLYGLMLASIADAVIVTDKDKKISVLNAAAERLFLYSQQEMIGKPIDAIVKFVKMDQQTPIDGDVWNQALTGTEPVSLQIDINVLDKKNTAIPVSAALSPIINKSAEHTGLIAVIRDIREQRQLEETRISFISVASHQLRTPLTSMRWFSEMLLGGDAGAINDEQKHFVERIYQGTDRMINLVSLLLQIARVEARRLKVDPKPTDLKNVTKGVELSLKVNLDAKKQTVLVSSQPENFPQLMIDQEIVWQVIQNLLSNANRYSPEKATIAVNIAQKGDIVEYSVTDKGIGIPESEKAKIFEKFYRAENALRYVPEGSGLGLSLVKSLVEGWGGKISFESKEGLGTTFTFTIPAKGMEKQEGDVSIAI
ncbi:MAG TPA: ATP-binding protein, partial [Pyrinomonadaceae bacterium]|nr:ATP-binding protein [Pyrinomonadaceae bacterium]